MIPFISNLLRLPVTRKEVLEIAKKHRKDGLCSSISYALIRFDLYPSLKLYFPKFTYKNARKFGATGGGYGYYWWTANEGDTGRMNFLNWLIEEYKDDNTNLRKL